MNGGSGQWKRLRSRMGHALDDDDDDCNVFRVVCTVYTFCTEIGYLESSCNKAEAPMTYTIWA